MKIELYSEMMMIDNEVSHGIIIYIPYLNSTFEFNSFSNALEPINWTKKGFKSFLTNSDPDFYYEKIGEL